NDRGVGDPAIDFEGLGGEMNSRVNAGPAESSLTKLSDMYKVVDYDGTLRIFRKMRDSSLDRDKWVSYRRRDFLEVCQSVLQLPRVECGARANGDPKYMPMAEFWLDQWRGKKTFKGMVMMPECSDERTPGGMLNMWTGFAFDPRPGSWGILKNLI